MNTVQAVHSWLRVVLDELACSMASFHRAEGRSYGFTRVDALTGDGLAETAGNWPQDMWAALERHAGGFTGDVSFYATAEWCVTVCRDGIEATGTATRPYLTFCCSPPQAAAVPVNVRRLGARLKEGEGCDVQGPGGPSRIVRQGLLLLAYRFPDPFLDGHHVGAVIAAA